ncbi:MAG: hypothetical protein A2498_09755 [Lentisphaerae bacterium RIFOXYC12_FULL_60_16]|nr:MAG: hypothetical protein A2498_09755 [Lentisphaerae bacterium RIFOXYC12_FULL_60_16]
MKTTRAGRATWQDGKLQMSAMIDVVFLLLTFFVFTIVPQDLESHLDVLRPRLQGSTDNPTILRVNVHADRLELNGRSMTRDGVDRFLERLGSMSRMATVVITCDGNSAHGGLVGVLDLCAKHGFANISLASR